MRLRFFNQALRVLLATNALILLAAAMIGPIYALFVEEIGGNLLDASLAGSLFALAAGITTFLSGRYSDNIRDTKKMVIFGYVVMGIGFLLYRYVDSIYFLFAVQVLIGFGEAIYSPAFDRMYSLNLNKDQAGEQWGAWEAMNYFALAVGAFLGGLIAHQFGFYVLFVVMAVMCFLSAIGLAKFLKD